MSSTKPTSQSLTPQPLSVTIWNEFIHEKSNEDARAVYPNGIHSAIEEGLVDLLGSQVSVRTATLEEPNHGLSDEVLDATDVMLWWGHMAHDQVSDEIAAKVHRRVLEGMGLIVLHSGHYSKVFRRLMGTECMLRWREAGEKERLWIVSPGHPIVEGIKGDFIELEKAEMYGEHFDIPNPEELVFLSWFEGGEVFRSGCTFRRGQGKIFYFRPGHETYPVYFHPQIRQVIANAVLWARPNSGNYDFDARHIPQPLESLGSDNA
ncbi:MAG: ThuA domain-containing protein [Pirellulaceae bacterium]